MSASDGYILGTTKIVDHGPDNTRWNLVIVGDGYRANEITQDQNPAILDTVARVYFEKGDLQAAIKWQRKAVKHAGETPMAEDLAATLEKYEALADSRL